MQNNHQHRSSRGRYFDDRSRRQRRVDGGHSNRTSRSHQRRTRNNSHGYRNQYPYNTYGRDQPTQQYPQNTYNDSRREYPPPESATRFNEPYYYDTSGGQYYSQDASWFTYQQANGYSPFVPYYLPWGSFQQADVYPNNHHYPVNENDWAGGLETPAYDNDNSRSPNNSYRHDAWDQPFWWEDNSEATKVLHEYFWRPTTGGEIRCIVCRRNYATVTGRGESIMSSSCGHLFCTGCLDYEDNSDLYSSYCWICSLRVTDLWKIFM